MLFSIPIHTTKTTHVGLIDHMNLNFFKHAQITHTSLRNSKSTSYLSQLPRLASFILFLQKSKAKKDFVWPSCYCIVLHYTLIVLTQAAACSEGFSGHHPSSGVWHSVVCVCVCVRGGEGRAAIGCDTNNRHSLGGALVIGHCHQCILTYICLCLVDGCA